MLVHIGIPEVQTVEYRNDGPRDAVDGVTAVVDASVARSRQELLSGAASRGVVDPSGARSGAGFERVEISGEPHFVKSVGYQTDWIMRVMGDRDLRTLKLWTAGVMAEVPPEIDHTVVGMAVDGEGEEAVLSILMRDVGGRLFGNGDSKLALDDHLALIDGLATLSTRFWGWRDHVGLTTMEERLRFFAPDNIASEAAVDEPRLPIRVAVQGWPRFAERAPDVWRLVQAIHTDPRPLTNAMRATPLAFLHGDWKMSNLGRHEDGRMILLELGASGVGTSLLGPCVVPRAQPRSASDHQGSHDRRVPTGAGTSRNHDRRLDRSTARTVPARNGCVFRMGKSNG